MLARESLSLRVFDLANEIDLHYCLPTTPPPLSRTSGKRPLLTTMRPFRSFQSHWPSTHKGCRPADRSHSDLSSVSIPHDTGTAENRSSASRTSVVVSNHQITLHASTLADVPSIRDPGRPKRRKSSPPAGQPAFATQIVAGGDALLPPDQNCPPQSRVPERPPAEMARRAPSSPDPGHTWSYR